MSIPSGYSFRKNSPYEKFISRKLTRLHHLFRSLKNSLDISHQRLSCDNAKESDSLSMMKLISLFIAMLAGIILSLGVLIFVKTIYRFKASRSEQKMAQSKSFSNRNLSLATKGTTVKNSSVPLVLHIKSL